MSQYGANTSMMVLLKRAGGPKGPQPSSASKITVVYAISYLFPVCVSRHVDTSKRTPTVMNYGNLLHTYKLEVQGAPCPSF